VGRIGDAVDSDSRDGDQSGHQLLGQRPLVGADGGHSRLQVQSTPLISRLWHNRSYCTETAEGILAFGFSVGVLFRSIPGNPNLLIKLAFGQLKRQRFSQRLFGMLGTIENDHWSMQI
jgi:hypothetical protein